MARTTSPSHYPLDLHCGRSVWEAAELTTMFRREPRPARTYFRHLLADHLRSTRGEAVSAAELGLLATLNRVLRVIAATFLEQRQCRVDRNAVRVAQISIPLTGLGATFSRFLRLFPALPVELTGDDIDAYLDNLEREDQLTELLVELILVFVQSRNPAVHGARQLFADEEVALQQQSAYQQQLQLLDRVLPRLDDGYPGQPPTLLERLLAPLRQGTDLYQQLLHLRATWGTLLPADLLAGIDVAVEQYRSEGHRPDFPGEPESVPLDPAAFIDQEYADFTADLAWMPRAVLLAKSTYVWLEQLSRRYARPIRTLDQIPDEELDALVDYGFTSLWLIGIWKRSAASLQVKNLCGQLNVAASAYAIDEYEVAAALGGEGAFANLRQRCLERGLDLACDVVTNHTGIESAWLRDHPDWFIQVPYSPYPGYRFSGPDLTPAADYAIQIEDGYYDHSEAAVVCRYRHRHTGAVRYIYHGNDGTHLPWNDTVQLNYLLADVREAMIRLILRVAKQFRIIRFDAAMTLAKKHFQRLWYPLPHGAGGVPSRSDHALGQEEFNRYFPVEFWRELVDRVQQEVPDTLLVAEAFWLMEGYFVRTLGMHRVYNSAFMNMLKREDNAKYRQTIKNILVFDPAILQRFVNFMSNPDEESAHEQFGDGDKYFCVATLLATMPGLPMFAHGQIEGLREKYGMEYLAPRKDEQPDREILRRHQATIFPLLRKRALFSGADHFQLYDFISSFSVEEDVFVYSNRLAERTVLVLCNNSPQTISGRIAAPVAMADREGLDLVAACDIDCSGDFVMMTDLSGAQQSLHPAAQLARGGTFNLQPYSARVLTEFVGLTDGDGRWQRLWQRYGDSGVRNLWLEHDALLLEPTWPLVSDLLALPRPERSRRRLRAQQDELCLLYATAELDRMSAEQFLELLVRTQFPAVQLSAADYAEVSALLAPAAEASFSWFQLLERISNRRALRPLLGCHYYDYTDWFLRSNFEQFCLVVLQLQLFRQRHSAATPARLEGLLAVLRALRLIRRRARQVNYRTDQLLAGLDPHPPFMDPLPPAAAGLKILFVASEATPFAKSGGLADVAGSLPRALRLLGHDVRVVIPAYPQVDQGPVVPRKAPHSTEITLEEVARRASLKEAVYDGVPYWFIDTPELFDRSGLYADASGDYPDNGLRFGFFCRAVLEMARTCAFAPDLIHLHDWQTGLIPVLLQTSYRGDPFFAATRTLLTIHNLGYHGIFPFSLLRQLELPTTLSSPAALEYYGNLSLLKGGIVFADLVNTVSPTYCREIQTVEQGYGFDGLLRERSANLHGILNGLDERLWNPATDPALPHHFTSRRLAGKARCKAALQHELGLNPEPTVPLVVVISRLDRQKGIDLIEAVWSRLLQRSLQFVLLGSGTAAAMDFWQQRQGSADGQVSINLTFNEGLSRRLYGAADLLLVPSRYEPCGLTQMIALKYGALPLVRRTGGLADTVIDVEETARNGYGFVFDDPDPEAFLATLDRALDVYARPRQWAQLVRRGMRQDFGWLPSARQYEELYQQLAVGSAAGAQKEDGH